MHQAAKPLPCLLSRLLTLLAQSPENQELLGACNVVRHALRILQPLVDPCDTPIAFRIATEKPVRVKCPGLCNIWDDLVFLDRQLHKTCQGRYHDMPPKQFENQDYEALFLAIVQSVKDLEQSCKKYEDVVSTLKKQVSPHVVLEKAMVYTNQ